MDTEIKKVEKDKEKRKRSGRLSNEQLRRSRAGTLSRFPSPEIYDPEDLAKIPAIVSPRSK